MKTILLKPWAVALAALALLLPIATTHAQDTYWLLDNNKHYSTVTQSASPSSSIGPASNPHARTVYDERGNELFSYGEDEITAYSSQYSSSGGIQAFPIIGTCRQYYVLNIFPDYGAHVSDMTLTKVDVSGGYPVLSSSVLLVGPGGFGASYTGSIWNYGAAAAPPNPDSSRYIYHLSGDINNSFCYLHRFKINADGSVVLTPQLLAQGLPLCAQRTRLKMAPDGQSFAYRDASNKLVTYNLNTGLATSYNVPCLGMAEATVSSSRRWFVSTGTELGYVTEGSASSYALISNTIGIHSDIAQGRYGNYYVAQGPLSTTPGELWYFNAATVTLPGGTFTQTNAFVVGVNGVSPTAYSFGNNVEGEDINSAVIVHNAPAQLAINGDLSSNPVQVLDCQPIVLTNTSNTHGYFYNIAIYENGYVKDATPAIVYGTFTSVDLRYLSANAYLSNHTGTFDVAVSFGTICGNIVQTIRRIEVTAGQVASMGIKTNYKMKAASNSPVTSHSYPTLSYAPDDPLSPNSPSNPQIVGRNQTIFDILPNTGIPIPGHVCDITTHIDQWNSSTSTWTNDVIPPENHYNGDCALIVSPALPLSGFLDANFNSWFPTVPNNTISRLRVDLTNQCGTISRAVVFKVVNVTFPNAYLREGADDFAASSVSFAPVPFGNQVTAVLQAAGDARATMRIFSVDGRLIATPLNDVPMQEGSQNVAVETASWPAGVYFYDCTIGDRHYNGKLVKQ